MSSYLSVLAGTDGPQIFISVASVSTSNSMQGKGITDIFRSHFRFGCINRSIRPYYPRGCRLTQRW
ncbi:hypothetical protein M408DRAFT_326643 [Serendipita vermifera MAFF 305830]|uniref:Uncharacterized protein n=1 Tax=Serendipita vermifera MAFF 305830 TaxID=933852 RepID=A0A0C3B808_SERVB|nr:hypothetical protein M408DRAFT_326643 [Serendipita vermifera MAFF 305830]